MTNSTSAEFWDQLYALDLRGEYSAIRLEIDPDDPVYPALRESLAFFGDIRGKRLLDLGCGSGSYSLFFARHGAQVVAVDISRTAIDRLTRHCRSSGISNVQPVSASALEIADHGPFDFVFGSMILHHIEPFDDFARVLRSAIAQDGKAFFFENSANSRLLIWFRDHLVGRFGIPKFGDDREFPLTPDELDSLRSHFTVEVVFPELYFFRLIPMYLLRGRLQAPFALLDRLGYRSPWLRRLSYRQFVYLSGVR